MRCKIYRSQHQALSYLYLAQGQQLADLPDDLRKSLGQLTWVMDLSLAERQKLAYADIEKVKQSLKQQGFYLQLPPEALKTIIM